ncbi:MAG: phosphate/phosphite/phosphonate ABC transporter substrate-binding protein [Nitrospirota bacterium]|nr:phosphate/phosphite/phosphonate ABC transporter substrate-binding protein [Nitrospirota bacterium]
MHPFVLPCQITIRLWRTAIAALPGVFLLAAAALPGGCGPVADGAHAAPYGIISHNPPPPVELHIGVLPDQLPAELAARYAPLVAYLGSTLGIPATLVPARDYQQLLDQLGDGRVDVALLGGVTFLIARQRGAILPLVMRRRDTHFASYFLVRGDQPATSLSDLGGARLAFGSRLSTSGHMMPRHYLMQEGIDAERFFGSVTHYDTHDLTIRALLDGNIDVAAVNSAIADRVLADPRIAPGTVRVLAKTPPYPDYVWVARSGLPDEFSSRVAAAFLRLRVDNPADAALLKSLDAKLYLPARNRDFASLREVMQQIHPEPLP